MLIDRRGTLVQAPEEIGILAGLQAIGAGRWVHDNSG